MGGHLALKDGGHLARWDVPVGPTYVALPYEEAFDALLEALDVAAAASVVHCYSAEWSVKAQTATYDWGAVAVLRQEDATTADRLRVVDCMDCAVIAAGPGSVSEDP